MKKYLNECISNNAVASIGNFIKKFEDLIKKFTGAKYCVYFVTELQQYILDYNH